MNYDHAALLLDRFKVATNYHGNAVSTYIYSTLISRRNISSVSVMGSVSAPHRLGPGSSPGVGKLFFHIRMQLMAHFQLL